MKMRSDRCNSDTRGRGRKRPPSSIVNSETTSEENEKVYRSKKKQIESAQTQVKRDKVEASTRTKEEERRKFKAAIEKSGDDVEKTRKRFSLAAIKVAEKVVGRSRNRQQKKATTWWNNNEVKEMLNRKMELYRKALNEKTEEAWERYKMVSKEAKKVVREAKGKIRLGWVSNCRRTLWIIGVHVGRM